MDKSVKSLQQGLTKLRTGRAHTSLLDHITVDYYGSEVPLNQCANVNVEDPRTLTVSPWEKSMVQPIEKAIMTSDLGLNPASAGTIIRVPLPPLTEERRKDMIKLVRHEAEPAATISRRIARAPQSPGAADPFRRTASPAPSRPGEPRHFGPTDGMPVAAPRRPTERSLPE